MITLRTNIKEVISGAQAKVAKLIGESKQDIVRAVSVGMLPVVHDRIHVNGLDASGTQIGTYSPEYMKVRTNTGFQSPTINRGPKKGSPRPNYNRSGDSKVILSLTRQMENDFTTIATEKGYGLGFKNQQNAVKAEAAEKTYRKKIYSLTPEEKELAVQIATEQIANALHQ